MEQKVSFNYFYGSQADQYSFYRIPKALFKNDYFRGLSSDAKILYGLMLDRMSLSIKNQWFDHENRAYIYFSIEDIMELLNCGRNKAVKSLQELDSCFLASNFPHFHRYDSLKSALYIHAVSKNINTFPKNQGRIRAAIAVEILDFTVMYR